MGSEEIAVLAAKLATLHEDVGEIKTAMVKLTDAITTLALVEERQARTGEALDRAFKAIERNEHRLAALEVKVPASDRISGWVDKGVWAAAAAAAMYIAKKAGLI